MVAPTELGHVHGDEGRGARPLNTASEEDSTHGSSRSTSGPEVTQHIEGQATADHRAMGSNAATARGAASPALLQREPQREVGGINPVGPLSSANVRTLAGSSAGMSPVVLMRNASAAVQRLVRGDDAAAAAGSARAEQPSMFDAKRQIHQQQQVPT